MKVNKKIVIKENKEWINSISIGNELNKYLLFKNKCCGKNILDLIITLFYCYS